MDKRATNDIDSVLTIAEIVRIAREKADPEAWDYMVGGSETETSLRRNRLALDKMAFRPRVLRDVSNIDTSREFLGWNLRLPLLLAPMGSLQQLDPAAAVPPAAAAKEFGVASFLSSVCPPGIEETMKQTDGDMMFQLYVRGDEQWILDHVDQASELGYKAFCLTVDTAYYGRRERDKMRGFTPAARRRIGGTDFQAGLDWNVVDRIRAHCKLPMALKGIATEEDAKLAVEHGIEIVYISNHGGRQLDYGRGCAELIPEIVDAVEGKAKVIVDGAVYRGTDLLKCIALGADVVAIGRLYGYGLAAGGKAGVIKVLEILEEEVINAMANLGITSMDQLNPDYLHPSDAVREPSVFSSFHLADIPDYTY
ncbi:MAG: alpha-hydroxy acid oxidase [Rhodospirillaceae bacterium]